MFNEKDTFQVKTGRVSFLCYELLYLGEFSVKFLRIARMEYCFADAVPVLREHQMLFEIVLYIRSKMQYNNHIL